MDGVTASGRIPLQKSISADDKNAVANWANGRLWRKAAIRRDQHVAEGPTPYMQRRIVDRVEPKTLFPFGAPGEGPRACGTIRWASPVIDTGSRFWFSPQRGLK
jgi:hypothetical protein